MSLKVRVLIPSLPCAKSHLFHTVPGFGSVLMSLVRGQSPRTKLHRVEMMDGVDCAFIYLLKSTLGLAKLDLCYSS